MTEAWVSALAKQADEAERFRNFHNLGPWDDGWCRSTARGSCPIDHLEVGPLQELADLGCRVQVEIEVERLRIRALAERSRQFVIETSGEWSDVVEYDASAAAASDAAVNNDLARLLALLPDLTADVTLTVLGKEIGVSWVRTADAFVRESECSGWFGLSRLLSPIAGVANHVLVLDGDSSVLQGEGLVVHGPAVWPTMPVWANDPLTYPDGDPRAASPSPTALLPAMTTGEQLESVADVLRAVAGALAWLWIADSVRVHDGTVSIRLAGNRPIEGELPKCPVGYAAPSVGVWNWVSVATEPARRHALMQAVSLQTESPEHLYSRSASILDTAQFLFSVSQSGLVQEALAARRSARDSAVEAGRSAGDRARAAARSAVDRVLVVVAAGVGVVLANKGDIINRPAAFGLIALAVALMLGAGLLAFHLDLPGAARTVNLFKKELGEHAEVLSPRDVDSIAKLPSLADGLADVQRARIATVAILGVAIVALLSLAAVVVAGHDRSGRPAGSTTTVVTVGPTTTVPPPATVTSLAPAATSGP